jgi:multiple sugar transport system permease protein
MQVGAATTSSLKSQAKGGLWHWLSRPAVREALTFYTYISPWIIGYLAFTVGPLIASIVISVTDWDILTPAKFVGLQNYVRMFTGDRLFWQSLKVTAIYSFAGIPLRLALALFLAILLNQPVKFRAFLRTLYYTPSVMAGVAVSMLWMWIFNPDFGVINFVLDKFGIQGPGWVYDEQWALPALIIMSLWGVGQPMVIFLAGLQGVPRSLYDAAEVDGAGLWHQFRAVTFPSISPVIFFNLIMGVIGSFQVFTQAFIMTQGGPHYATYFYVYHLYNNAFRDLRMGYGSALAWMLFWIIILLTLAIFRSTPMWLYYEGELKKEK